MGFGFNLFGFPILILTSIGLLICFCITKKKIALKAIAGLWVLTILIVFSGLTRDYYTTPIRLTKQDIIGEYRIDTTFFAGANATWQYKRYKFFITERDSILFVINGNNNIQSKIYKHKLRYSDGSPLLWSIGTDSTCHVIRNAPTLFRGHKRFYYVLRSNKFGNMFFRKRVL